MRPTILWVGTKAPNDLEVALRDRGLHLVSVDLLQCRSLFEGARAITFADPDAQSLDRLREGLLTEAIAHGLAVRISVALDRVKQVANLFSKELSDIKELRVYTGEFHNRLPEEFARLSVGPSFDSFLEIQGDKDCNDEERILLRRAFSDCVQVRLQPLPDGTAKVFHAYVKLKDSRVGAYPLPMFVKLDKRRKARRELENYRECTTQFIPFFARPNLAPQRCLLGATRGLIVGDFVERSESLQDLVQRGVAQPAIDSLFQDALRGWRAQPYWGNASNTAPRPLQEEALPKSYLMRRGDLVDAYSKEAVGLGAAMSAREVAAVLDGLAPIPHRRGWCHGDLRGFNVRVRDTTAILIDFAAVGEGALARDPAALETSLTLKFMAPQEQWVQVVTELYQLEHLRSVPRPREPMAPLEALWNTIRQVRRYGLAEELTDFEYARAVAIQLLQHALRPRDTGEQRVRRPLYIKLAAELAKGLLHMDGAKRDSVAEACSSSEPSSKSVMGER